ncbi:MAG: hypothetical protein ACYTEV_12615 [Planctomycetota bacterium]|jgi:hypothetical protein
MIAVLAVNLGALAVLAWRVWRVGHDFGGEGDRAGFVLKTAAVVLLSMQAGVLAMFGVGEILGGDPSGAGHLVTLAFVAALAMLAWRRPLDGGVALLVVAAANTTLFRTPVAFGIMVAPHLLAAAGLLLAGWRSRRAGRDASHATP